MRTFSYVFRVLPLVVALSVSAAAQETRPIKALMIAGGCCHDYPNQARILTDLVVRGYDGWLSIEPHIAAAVHLGREPEGDDARRIWIDYAHRIEQVAEAAANAAT